MIENELGRPSLYPLKDHNVFNEVRPPDYKVLDGQVSNKVAFW
uniref:Uncharacterized protein n=1 Tax=Amphimedon queenslandica TaxID=400682 RepID=A0A1X7VRN3_AMPQE